MMWSQRNKQRVYVLAGPTAAGKSSIVHHLAQKYGLAVLSADSMAVYSGMDIGTAKASRREQSEVRYYGIDLISPDRPFSVGDYLSYVTQHVRDPEFIVAGGSGLYIKCLLSGLEPSPPPDPAFREAMNRLLNEQGLEALQAYACKNAPEAYRQLQDNKNPRRIIRALEKVRTSSVFDPSRKQESEKRPVLIGLQWDREELGRRIAQRVHTMYADGLLDEAETLQKQYPDLSATAMQAIGYREAFAVLRGELTRNEAIGQTVLRSRQFAKRQMTWYNRQFDMQWIDLAPTSCFQETADQVWSLWSRFPASLYTKE